MRGKHIPWLGCNRIELPYMSRCPGKSTTVNTIPRTALAPMSLHIPPFDSLPLRKDGPRGNAWGLFGEQDEIGMLNRLTPENTTAAAREIVEGVRISTDWNLNSMATPCFGRSAFEHTIKNKAPRTVNDDVLLFNTQSSSQWDGFRHYGSREGSYFNDCSHEDIQQSTRNGIHSRLLPRYSKLVLENAFLTRHISVGGTGRSRGSWSASGLRRVGRGQRRHRQLLPNPVYSTLGSSAGSRQPEYDIPTGRYSVHSNGLDPRIREALSERVSAACGLQGTARHRRQIVERDTAMDLG